MWTRWAPGPGNFAAVPSIHESEKAENHCINPTVINKRIATYTNVFLDKRMLRSVGLLESERETERKRERERVGERKIGNTVRRFLLFNLHMLL
jgi:hypothetical protein